VTRTPKGHKDSNNQKVLFMEIKAFMQVTKKGNAFFIYVLPT
jgi:hypothetical protein